MKSRQTKLALLLLVIASVAACAGVRTRRTDLRDAVHDYNVAVRWGHVQKAATFIPNKQRGEFVVRKRQAMARMKIHEISIRNVRMKSDNEEAIVLVQLSFSVGADPIINRHLVQQKWRYRLGRWLLTARRRIEASSVDRTPKPGDLY
ncbi:MAG: hypothetical protein KC502_03855 [Myxococcales bacterium]|nr:hypothetical protein [Myxococcales bacterium]